MREPDEKQRQSDANKMSQKQQQNKSRGTHKNRTRRILTEILRLKVPKKRKQLTVARIQNSRNVTAEGKFVGSGLVTRLQCCKEVMMRRRQNKERFINIKSNP
ncbi:hypothetical protein NDU88_010491 [Pleurodeles waltl]|uniref:Uncharacterized protein n=1 Tax=Pleurodeles waltl TaxID=8319 RepID=A0AAV7PW68_PLEWA|nr:hypothetical protein NDU88_010491 [Pleurodeles waltl]